MLSEHSRHWRSIFLIAIRDPCSLGSHKVGRADTLHAKTTRLMDDMRTGSGVAMPRQDIACSTVLQPFLDWDCWIKRCGMPSF